MLAFGGYGSLDLGEICELRPWKGSSFEFGRARSSVRIGMVRGKRTPLRLGRGESIFAAIYYKSLHLARGRRSARSRRDLPIAPLERLQLRVLATTHSPVRIGMLPGKNIPVRHLVVRKQNDFGVRKLQR